MDDKTWLENLEKGVPYVPNTKNNKEEECPCCRLKKPKKVDWRKEMIKNKK